MNVINNNCRIYKVSGWLDLKGFEKRILELEAKETDKLFISEGRKINKNKMLKIDTIFFENHMSIRYFTYCLEDDKQKALDLIKDHIISKINIYKKEIDILHSYVVESSL